MLVLPPEVLVFDLELARLLGNEAISFVLVSVNLSDVGDLVAHDVVVELDLLLYLSFGLSDLCRGPGD